MTVTSDVVQNVKGGNVVAFDQQSGRLNYLIPYVYVKHHLQHNADQMITSDDTQ